MNLRNFDARILATVTVTFNPDLSLLENQLRLLPETCRKVVVDNASSPDCVEEIESLAARIANVRLLRNADNLGLAAAINHGVMAAATEVSPSPQWLLLLDQDSEPRPGSIEALVDAFDAMVAKGERVGCVGPLLRDPATGLTHGFHQCSSWRWKRMHPSAESVEPVSCSNLNGSGTLVSMALFRQLGGLDESMFIDHVDTEWSFRVLAAGYSLWGAPAALFDHRMGEASLRFWCFGWRVWPSRSPQRHYFLFRNAIWLMRRDYVPRVWKLWAVVKMLLTAIVVGILGPMRRRQWLFMRRGIREGMSRSSPVDMKPKQMIR